MLICGVRPFKTLKDFFNAVERLEQKPPDKPAKPPE